MQRILEGTASTKESQPLKIPRAVEVGCCCYLDFQVSNYSDLQTPLECSLRSPPAAGYLASNIRIHFTIVDEICEWLLDLSALWWKHKKNPGFFPKEREVKESQKRFEWLARPNGYSSWREKRLYLGKWKSWCERGGKKGFIHGGCLTQGPAVSNQEH